MQKNILSLSFLILALAFNACQQTSKGSLGGSISPAAMESITIPQLLEEYKQGKHTVRELVAWYLHRIDSLDKNGPALNSIIVVNPDALAIADELDKELAAGKSRGPLHGIPIILKDNIDTHDKMPTTAGATALKNSFPAVDSWVAKKLREAGAVIIAKSNLSEWANFRASTSSSGWSGVGGQTKNPYILDCNPCGSSSGSGASMAANLGMIAIGTETNGSIVCPSNNNGLVGIKPTVGLVSRTGIIPISFSQDTPGPMGRTVTDVAACLGPMTGIDTSDSKTLGAQVNAKTDYIQYLKKDGLKGKRIGLMKESMGFSGKVDELMRKTVEALKKQGATVIELEPMKDQSYGNASYQVLLYEFKDGLNRYFAGLGKNAPVKTLKGLIEFNKKDPVELNYFDQKILEEAEAKGSLDEAEYKDALAKMWKLTREEGIDLLMKQYQLDALMAPTGSPAWKTDLVNGDHFIGGSSSLAAISGYPSITVPMGFVSELPVGVSFFGKAWSEPTLFEIAYAYEQATKHRKAPKFLASN
jgi:amidase